MTAYLIRRLFQMVIVVFAVSLFMFFLFNIAPGGPLTGLQQQQRLSLIHISEPTRPY